MTEMTRAQQNKLALEGMHKLFLLWELELKESAGLLKMTAEEWNQVAAEIL